MALWHQFRLIIMFAVNSCRKKVVSSYSFQCFTSVCFCWTELLRHELLNMNVKGKVALIEPSRQVRTQLSDFTYLKCVGILLTHFFFISSAFLPVSRAVHSTIAKGKIIIQMQLHISNFTLCFVYVEIFLPSLSHADHWTLYKKNIHWKKFTHLKLFFIFRLSLFRCSLSRIFF